MTSTFDDAALGPADATDLDVNEWIASTVLATQADPRAFEPLYRAFQPLVHAYCQRRIGSSDLAADLTSQVFVKALRSIGRFRIDPGRPHSSFRSWLFAIAHNEVVDAYRCHRHHDSLDDSETFGRVASSRVLPDEEALAHDTSAEVLRCLSRLPERQRAVIELRMIGFSRREIADVLGMSEAAVRSAQFRGFATLRELLGPWRGRDDMEKPR